MVFRCRRPIIRFRVSGIYKNNSRNTLEIFPLNIKPPNYNPLNIKTISGFLRRLPQFAWFVIAAFFTTGTLQAEATQYGRSTVKPPITSLLATATGSQPQHQKLQSEFVPLEILNESLWQRLSDGFEFSTLENDRIDRQLMFLQSGLKSLRSNLIDAGPYLFYIADRLDRSRMPLDIALLPLIESAFNPTALSSESAVGIWQFIPATASHYGLSVRKNNDQRKDVMASTTAAIRYLSDLHRQFEGDWLLALAAYNTGPGNVRAAMRKAVKRGKEPVYWNLKLSKETSNYVPRLIAATKMIHNPQLYGLTLPPLANQKRIESVSVGRRISLQQVAELTDISLEEVTYLNQGLHRGLTPVDGPHRLILPVEVIPELLEELAKFKRQPLVNQKSHPATVTRDANDSYTIDSRVESTSNSLQNQHYATYKTYHYKTHTVEKGDSLWKVSRKLNVDIDTLRQWNDLEPGEPIKTGDKLSVAYITNDLVDTGGSNLINYRVFATDTLTGIADKFHLPIGEIKKWNSSLRYENHLQAGQLLRIPLRLPQTDDSTYGP